MLFTMMAGKVILAILNDLLLCVIGVLGGGVTRTIRMLSHDPEGGGKGILAVAYSSILGKFLAWSTVCRF